MIDGTNDADKLMNGLEDSGLESSKEKAITEGLEAGCDPLQDAAQVQTARRPVSIVIAYSHMMFREALRLFLEAEPDLKVIGEANDGAEAVNLTRELKPDLLLLGLAMPKHPGLRHLKSSVRTQGRTELG